MLSFKEYNIRESLLIAYENYFAESFSLRETKFGNNENLYDNEEWNKTGNKLTTYFLDNELLVKVDLINDGKTWHVKFSYHNGKTFTYKMRYDLDSSLFLFNKIMFIVSKAIENFEIEQIGFGAHESNEKLKPVYGRMITNKSFLKMMKTKSFSYEGEQDGIYIFGNKK